MLAFSSWTVTMTCLQQEHDVYCSHQLNQCSIHPSLAPIRRNCANTRCNLLYIVKDACHDA